MDIKNTAIIIVDFQNDFVDGTLSIKAGSAGQDPDDAIEPLNALLSRADDFNTILYTMDWHPPNHISFIDNCHDDDRKLSMSAENETIRIGDTLQFEIPPIKQTLYPVHCVQGTRGAEIYPKLLHVEGANYIRKGITKFSESYSAFVDNEGKNRTDLEELLVKNGVKMVFICGLALDICVFWTARDAVNAGFITAVIMDCSKGLDNEGIERTKYEFDKLGVAMITSKEVAQFLDEKRIPQHWIDSLLAKRKQK